MGTGEEKRGPTRGDVYRQARIWHGYLSALAFLALIFFSATGILLNHPDWLQSDPVAPSEQAFTLAPEDLARVRAAPDPPAEIAKLAAGRLDLAGAYRSGETAGKDVFIRMDGVRGLSDIRADLETGEVAAVVERYPAIPVLNGLHRAEHSGQAWRLAVDAIAILLIVTSLLGLVLFLSLRFRLATSLALIGASLVILGAIFVFAVP